MQVAGGGGGITVNPEAALKAAQGFETEGEAIDDAKSKADTVEGTLPGGRAKRRTTPRSPSRCSAAA